MSLGAMILGSRGGAYIGVVKVDVVKQDNISISSQTTDLPVELGYNISDHVIVEPIKVSCSFYVSDYSLYTSSGVASKAAETYALLKLQHNLKLPIWYINSLDIFPIMHIESISIPRGADDGRGLNFDVNLKEIRIILPLGVPFAGAMLGGAAGIMQQCSSLVTL